MDARTEKEGTPAKKPKPSCKYRDQWDNGFIFLKKSRVGDSHAFCKIVTVTLASHMGEGMMYASTRNPPSTSAG